MGNQNDCEGCFYQKVRDVYPDTKKLSFGPFCLQSGQPVRCERAVFECLNNIRQQIDNTEKGQIR